MHFVSDKSLERPGYIYKNGVGYPAGLKPEVIWNHIDGPLVYLSALWLGLTTEEAIDADYVSGRKRDW